jgi:hypothetical protein
VGVGHDLDDGGGVGRILDDDGLDGLLHALPHQLSALALDALFLLALLGVPVGAVCEVETPLEGGGDCSLGPVVHGCRPWL